MIVITYYLQTLWNSALLQCVFFISFGLITKIKFLKQYAGKSSTLFPKITVATQNQIDACEQTFHVCTAPQTYDLFIFSYMILL